MTPESLERLQAAVAKRSDKKGMYLKPMRDSISMRTGGRGGELLMQAKTIHGVVKQYHLVPDEQGLAKIVVSPERKAIAPRRVNTLTHGVPETKQAIVAAEGEPDRGNPPDDEITEVK